MKPDDILLSLLVEPSAIADPYPLYRQLREETPMFQMEASGMWVVSEFEKVKTLLRDPRCGNAPYEQSAAPLLIAGSRQRNRDPEAVSMLEISLMG